MAATRHVDAVAQLMGDIPESWRASPRLRDGRGTFRRLIMVCCWSAIRARWRVSDWGNRGLALAWSVLRASPPEYRPRLRYGVHVPRCCHPLVRPSSSVAERYTYLAPGEGSLEHDRHCYSQIVARRSHRRACAANGALTVGAGACHTWGHRSLSPGAGVVLQVQGVGRPHVVYVTGARRSGAGVEDCGYGVQILI